MPRNKLGELLVRRPSLDALSVAVVFAPMLVTLALVMVGVLDPTDRAVERFDWWSIVFSMGLIWLILWSRGDPPAAIGLGRPASWLRTVMLAVGIMVVALVAAQVTQLLAAPFTEGRSPDTSRFDKIRGDPRMLFTALLSVWFNAAFGEELIWRGFLLTRLPHLLGGNRAATWVSVVIGSALFGLLHAYQGLAGVLTTGAVALVFSVFFVLIRRNLWALILAHGLLHLLSFTAIYFGATSGD